MIGQFPDAVSHWCMENGYGEILSQSPVGGGCINNGARLRTSSGRTLFVKTNTHNPSDMFMRESEGLRALRDAHCVRVPEPYLEGKDFLLMEDLAPTGRKSSFWQSLGRGLAAIHKHSAERFGFAHDNYIGATPQVNAWSEDGYAFFGEKRLVFQAELAVRKRELSQAELRQVERLAGRLRELIPVQPPSLLHGDLWSGNVISDENGEPALIDPATHYGWGEADLGMTALFGGFPAEFYRAYQEVRPLDPGWQERLPLYNLYHLLNHLNLFGGGYLGQVRSVLHRYASA